MAKPFSTYEGMIETLNLRGVSTDEDTVDTLKRENYYCVVNGYKDFFLDPISQTEQYKAGTSFRDIYTLFLFDRELRFLFFKRILAVEATFKSIIAYRASEHYKDDQEFYLDESSYSDSQELNKEVSNTLSRMTGYKNSKLPSITHYRNTHGAVPFWVIIKNAPFGALSYFYKLLSERGIKQRVANDLMDMFQKEYGRRQKITIEQLERDLWILVDFRNACAHDERFYCRVCERVNVLPDQPANVAYLVVALSRYLSKQERESFQADLVKLISDLMSNARLSGEIVTKVLLSIGLKLGD